MIAYLSAKFDELNKQCFSGKLMRPEIRLNTRLRALGVMRTSIMKDKEGNVRRKDMWIEISTRRDLSEDTLTHVLLHEMIHYYIAFHDLKDDGMHGKLFVEIMEKLNREHGYHLTVKYASTDEELINLRTHERHVCVMRFGSGEYGVMVVAKNRLRELDKEARERPDVSEITWYVSDREIFGKFPVAVRLRWCPIDEEKLNVYLIGARIEKNLFKSSPIEDVSQESMEMFGVDWLMAFIGCVPI